MPAKIISVNSSTINSCSLLPSHYINQHKKAVRAYQRRLVRLFRCHYLPHHICRILSISNHEFMRDIEESDSKGICLNYDARQEAEFIILPPPSTLSKAQREHLIEDNQFYLSQGIPASERCRLLQLTRSRLRDLDTIETAKPKLNREERNAAIVKLYTETENKRGLKAKLADTFQLSRKSIDLILIQHDVDAVITSPHTMNASRPSKADGILALYEKLLKNGTPPIDIKSQIAAKMGCSYAYVHKVLKAKTP